MEYLSIVALIPWLLLGNRILRARPEWGVVLGLLPSLFFTEDLHENFWIRDASERIQTFHSLKVAGFFRPTEVIMLLLLVVLIHQIRRHRQRVQSPLNREIILLIVLCPLAGVISAFRGADPVFALSYHAWRTFWWGLIFFFYCLYALDEQKVEIYFKVFYLGFLLRMAYGIVKYLLGYGETHNIYPDTQIVFWDGMDLHLASACLVVSVVLLFQREGAISKSTLVWGLLLSTFTVMFSLRRGAIANAVFATVAILLIFPLKNRFKLIGGASATLLIGIILLSALSGGPGSRAPTDIVVERIAQVFAADIEAEHDFHYFDPIDHFLAISQQPITGLGFGMPYERIFSAKHREETTFSHNAYLFVWGGMGIVGLIIYVTLYTRTVLLARALYIKKMYSMLPVAYLAFILTGLVQGIYSTTNFTSSRMPFVLFFFTALLVKLLNRIDNMSDMEENARG